MFIPTNALAHHIIIISAVANANGAYKTREMLLAMVLMQLNEFVWKMVVYSLRFLGVIICKCARECPQQNMANVGHNINCSAAANCINVENKKKTIYTKEINKTTSVDNCVVEDRTGKFRMRKSSPQPSFPNTVHRYRHVVWEVGSSKYIGADERVSACKYVQRCFHFAPYRSTECA